MDVTEYATSYDGPTNTFLHGKINSEALLQLGYQEYMSNKSCDFKKFNHEPFKARFKEVDYSGMSFYKL